MEKFIGESKNGTLLFKRAYMDYHADRFDDLSLICSAGDRFVALLPANINGETGHSHQGLSYGGFVIDRAMMTPLICDVVNAAMGRIRTWRVSDVLLD
jgi:hypothetical protein